MVLPTERHVNPDRDQGDRHQQKARKLHPATRSSGSKKREGGREKYAEHGCLHDQQQRALPPQASAVRASLKPSRRFADRPAGAFGLVDQKLDRMERMVPLHSGLLTAAHFGAPYLSATVSATGLFRSLGFLNLIPSAFLRNPVSFATVGRSANVHWVRDAILSGLG